MTSKWSCSRCTYINVQHDIYCTICGKMNQFVINKDTSLAVTLCADKNSNVLSFNDRQLAILLQQSFDKENENNKRMKIITKKYLSLKPN